MILNDMNELDLIEYFQTFNVIDVYDESLISEHLFDDIFDFFSIETILIFDPDPYFEAIFLRHFYLDINLLILKFVVLEFNSGRAVIVAWLCHYVLRLHENCVANSADVSQNSLDRLLVHHGQGRGFNENFS